MNIEKELPPETEGEKILRLLEEHGLLGCMEGDGHLSENYKEHLWYHAFTEAGLLGCVETDLQLASAYKEKLDFSGKIGGKDDHEKT